MCMKSLPSLWLNRPRFEVRSDHRLGRTLGAWVLAWVGVVAWMGLSWAQAAPLAQTETQSKAPWASLDAEIALLKAQLAYEEGALTAMRQALDQFEQDAQTFPLSTALKQRYRSLRQHWQQAKSAASETRHSTRPDKTWPTELHQWLFLLPLSGDYAKAGQAIEQGLRDVIAHIEPTAQIEVVDVAVFDQPNQWQQWVELTQPDVIVGPLVPERVAKAQQWSPGPPLLLLNRPPLHPPMDTQPEWPEGVHVLTPGLHHLGVLERLLTQNGFERVLILWQSTPKVRALKQRFDQAWWQSSSTQTLDFAPLRPALVHQWIESGVQKALAQGLNLQASKGRAYWLSKTLDQQLQSQARPRQDFDAVVTIAPQSQALLVSPLMRFHQYQGRPHYWLAHPLPDLPVFQRAQNDWQTTLGVLPTYFAQQAGLAPPRDTAHALSSPSEQVGTFYALGQSAAQLLQQWQPNAPAEIETAMGSVLQDSQGVFYFAPRVFWMDAGLIEPY